MLGDKLQDLRKKQNLTQNEVAKMFKITPATVSAWEKNKTQPNLNDLVKLANLYNVTPDYLLGFNSEKKDELERAMLNAGYNQTEFEYAIQQIELFRKFKKEQKK